MFFLCSLCFFKTKNKELRIVWFLFFKTVFENSENTIFMLFENCFCYLNLIFFFVLFVFFRTKNKELRAVWYVFLKIVIENSFFKLFLRTVFKNL